MRKALLIFLLALLIGGYFAYMKVEVIQQARYSHALNILSKGKIERAYGEINSLAESGYFPAQQRLAFDYSYGFGEVKSDDVLASKWERKVFLTLVEKYHDKTITSLELEDLGNMYLEGHGINKSGYDAETYFIASAAMGNLSALNALSKSYYNGHLTDWGYALFLLYKDLSKNPNLKNENYYSWDGPEFLNKKNADKKKEDFKKTYEETLLKFKQEGRIK